MKRFVVTLGTVLALLAISAMLTPAKAWSVTEEKTKWLSIAGYVTFTSSISAVDGETITISLISSEFGYTISGVSLKKSTPNGLGSIDSGIPYGGGWKIDVTVHSGGDTTLHLSLWLTSGERVGVNIHF